jgi:hypothetical protein
MRGEKSDTPSKTNKTQNPAERSAKPSKKKCKTTATFMKCIKPEEQDYLNEFGQWCIKGGKRKTKKRSVSKRRKTRHYRK